MIGSQSQFYRTCLVSVVDAGGVVKQVRGYDSDGPARSGLRVGFHVEKRVSSTADTATVRIYNLNRDSRALLAQRSIYLPGNRREPIRYLQLSAGYRGQQGAIFNGTVVRVSHSRQGPDTVTTIEASAAMAQALSNTVQLSWGSVAGTSVKEIATVRADKAGLGVPVFRSDAETLAVAKKLNTLAASGSAYGALRNLLESNGLNMTVDVDGLTVTVPGYPLDPFNPLQVHEETGLLGAPSITDLGTEFRTLLNPKLRPGSLVELTSLTLAESTPGLGNKFTVWSTTITGDTHADDWYTDAVAQFYPPLLGFSENVNAVRALDPPT